MTKLTFSTLKETIKHLLVEKNTGQSEMCVYSMETRLTLMLISLFNERRKKTTALKRLEIFLPSVRDPQGKLSWEKHSI